MVNTTESWGQRPMSQTALAGSWCVRSKETQPLCKAALPTREPSMGTDSQPRRTVWRPRTSYSALFVVLGPRDIHGERGLILLLHSSCCACCVSCALTAHCFLSLPPFGLRTDAESYETRVSSVFHTSRTTAHQKMGRSTCVKHTAALKKGRLCSQGTASAYAAGS